ncbi:multidrug/biocide efflux PACE transporter [Pseudomonas sp. NPDC008258]|uniref:multidrug/biocide efflux PACE transporter n=1 Tax=Pseudomonas sp. NPDC008258 TaxID=3364418 RepID=UPI0036E9728D
MNVERGFLERLFHAFVFEVVAVVTFSPVISWFTGGSLASVGLLTFVISGMAIVWNLIFNFLFDVVEVRLELRRTMLVRFTHALLFEAGLILVVVPLMAWWLSVSLIQAFLLDIGLLLMFLPYTVAFNWVYDKLRESVISRRRRFELLCK